MARLSTVFVTCIILFTSIDRVHAQVDSAKAKKQINTVDVNRSKNKVTITYTDGSLEIMTEQEANKKGLIYNGGYSNAPALNTPGKTGEIRNPGSPSSKPIFVLDGKEITEEEMSKIVPSTIESINVVKDKAATDKYGVKGRNGVVEVKTKKSEPAPDEFNGKKIYEWLGGITSDEIISFQMTNIKIKREGIERKLPAQLHQF